MLLTISLRKSIFIAALATLPLYYVDNTNTGKPVSDHSFSGD